MNEEEAMSMMKRMGVQFTYNGSPLGYGKWIMDNCIVSRNGFRLEPSLKEEISNERAYELYLESLKYIK